MTTIQAPTEQSIATAKELYRRMYLIRAAEDAIIKKYNENDMKTPMHMSTGAEAIAAAVCLAIGDGGQCLSSYRSHATYIARTMETDRFFLELYGRQGGTADGRAGSMHLAAPDHGYLGASAIVASVIPVATGVGFSLKRLGSGNIAAVFFGDGAIDEGSFWESLNMACAWRLPVLFICEDNGFAVHTPADARHGYASITEIVSKFRVVFAETESTEASTLFDVTKKVMADMYATSRPGFMRMHYYRYLEHVGVNEDYNAGYRAREDYERWLKIDPLRVQRQRLVEWGVAEDWIGGVERDLQGQVLKSVEHAIAAPSPSPSILFRKSGSK